jgi:hypothetical protein
MKAWIFIGGKTGKVGILRHIQLDLRTNGILAIFKAFAGSVEIIKQLFLEITT